MATGLTAAISLVGIGLSIFGASKQAKAQKKLTNASLAAEAARKSQASNEAAIRRRRAIREAQIARANAVSNSVTQGVDSGSSSVVGGQFAIDSSARRNVRNVNTGEAIGNRIFTANANVARARGQASTGQGISSIGGSLFNSADQLGSLGEFSLSSVG